MRRNQKMFLSDSPDEFGSLAYYVKTAKRENISSSFYGTPTVDCELRLTDCSTSIVLDFESRDQESFEKRLEKVDKMIQALQDMRTDLVAGNEERIVLQEMLDKLKEDSTSDLETCIRAHARSVQWSGTINIEEDDDENY